jgi:hypothetical protein
MENFHVSPTGKVIAGIVIANFFLFVIISMLIGGDALNGHVTNGHYFLTMKGVDTEVTESVFRYSWWHAVLTIGSFAIAILHWALIDRRRGKTIVTP